MSNSRRASSPNTKKKNVISPLLTHSRRLSDTPSPASRTDSRAPHTASYDDTLRLTHTSAATAAPSSTTALPVSVRKNTRSGVCRLRAHAVRPEKARAPAAGVPPTRFLLQPEPAALGLARPTATDRKRLRASAAACHSGRKIMVTAPGADRRGLRRPGTIIGHHVHHPFINSLSGKVTPAWEQNGSGGRSSGAVRRGHRVRANAL